MNFYFRSRDQNTVATLLMVVFGLLFLRWLSVGNVSSEFQTVEFDHVQKSFASLEVDVNQAEWTELALLPGIGENLAKRIIHFREQNGSFQRIDELGNVKGIGPKKLNAMRPYLSH